MERPVHITSENGLFPSFIQGAFPKRWTQRPSPRGIWLLELRGCCPESPADSRPQGRESAALICSPVTLDGQAPS